jgi:hypothetical protein
LYRASFTHKCVRFSVSSFEDGSQTLHAPESGVHWRHRRHSTLSAIAAAACKARTSESKRRLAVIYFSLASQPFLNAGKTVSEGQRVELWEQVLAQPPDVARKDARVLELITQGVPAVIRPRAWMLLSGAMAERSRHPKSYFASLTAIAKMHGWGFRLVRSSPVILAVDSHKHLQVRSRR